MSYRRRVLNIALLFFSYHLLITSTFRRRKVTLTKFCIINFYRFFTHHCFDTANCILQCFYSCVHFLCHLQEIYTLSHFIIRIRRDLLLILGWMGLRIRVGVCRGFRIRGSRVKRLCLMYGLHVNIFLYIM